MFFIRTFRTGYFLCEGWCAMLVVDVLVYVCVLGDRMRGVELC